MKRAIYSDAALADLLAIWTFIATDNVDAADRWDKTLRTAADRLANGFPLLTGHRRADIRDPDILVWNVGFHVIAYRVRDGIAEVARVVHGARDFSTIDWERRA